MVVNIGLEQVKLMMFHVENIIKNKVPMDNEKLISNIQYETGFSRKKIQEILKIMYDLDKITIDNDGIVSMLEAGE